MKDETHSHPERPTVNEMDHYTIYLLQVWKANLLKEDASDAQNTPDGQQTKLPIDVVRNVKTALLDSFPLPKEHPRHGVSAELSNKWTAALAQVAENKKVSNIGRKKVKSPVFKELESLFKDELDDALATKRAKKASKLQARKCVPKMEVPPLVMGNVEDIGQNITAIHEDLPLHLGFTLGPLSATLMKFLCMQYGSIPYKQLFEQHSESIISSEFDRKFGLYKHGHRETKDDAMRVARKNQENEDKMQDGLHYYI